MLNQTARKRMIVDALLLYFFIFFCFFLSLSFCLSNSSVCSVTFLVVPHLLLAANATETTQKIFRVTCNSMRMHLVCRFHTIVRISFFFLYVQTSTPSTNIDQSNGRTNFLICRERKIYFFASTFAFQPNEKSKNFYFFLLSPSASLPSIGLCDSLRFVFRLFRVWRSISRAMLSASRIKIRELCRPLSGLSHHHHHHTFASQCWSSTANTQARKLFYSLQCFVVVPSPTSGDFRRTQHLWCNNSLFGSWCVCFAIIFFAFFVQVLIFSHWIQYLCTMGTVRCSEAEEKKTLDWSFTR